MEQPGFPAERAFCHEAGHVVVARYFGISVDSVKMVGGYPVTYVYISELNQLPASQQYAYLAGGVAAEQFVYGDYDTLGMGGDQAEITRRHGGAIGLYPLPAGRADDSEVKLKMVPQSQNENEIAMGCREYGSSVGSRHRFICDSDCGRD